MVRTFSSKWGRLCYTMVIIGCHHALIGLHRVSKDRLTGPRRFSRAPMPVQPPADQFVLRDLGCSVCAI